MSRVRRVALVLAILSTLLPFGIALARQYSAESFAAAGHPYGRRYVVRFYSNPDALQIYRDGYYWIRFRFEEMQGFTVMAALLAWCGVACVEVAVRVIVMRKSRAIGFDVVVRPQRPGAAPAGNGASGELESGR